MGVGSGLDQPATDGVGYGREVIDEAGESQLALEVGLETGSVAIKTEENTGDIYVGFDEDVSSVNGFPLGPGESIVLDIDNSSQPIFVAGDNADDAFRWLATN